MTNDDGPRIGLALSGGDSRAIAFHLGCLRALDDRGNLSQTRVISSVSGGSVIAAMYAYPTDFLPMSDEDINLLSLRGEQLTRLLIARYMPEL